MRHTTSGEAAALLQRASHCSANMALAQRNSMCSPPTFPRREKYGRALSPRSANFKTCPRILRGWLRQHKHAKPVSLGCPLPQIALRHTSIEARPAFNTLQILPPHNRTSHLAERMQVLDTSRVHKKELSMGCRLAPLRQRSLANAQED